MGSKGPSSEDPMDLGGFMANYVLKNPFDGPPLDPDRPPSTAKAVTAHLVTSSPPSPLSDSPVDLSRAHVKISPSDLSRTHMKTSPSDLSRAIVKTSPAPMTSRKSPSLFGSEEGEDSMENQEIPEQDLVDSAVRKAWLNDTPKYHIGSNMIYAASLKNRRVSMFNRDVQTWLLSNFRHEPGCGDQVTMNDILQSVVVQFPHVNSVSLSRIMKFTFPDCLKSVTKHGSIYRDLTVAHSSPPIPQPADYRNLPLVMAANQVKLNNMRLEVAAEKYGVDSNLIAQLSMYHADDACVPFDPILEKQIDGDMKIGALASPKETEKKCRRKRSHPECRGSSSQEWQPPVGDENTTRAKGSSRRKSGRVRKLKKFEEFITENHADHNSKVRRLEDAADVSAAKERCGEDESSNDSNSCVDRASPDAMVAGFPLLRQLLEKHGLPPSLVRGTIRRHNDQYLVGDCGKAGLQGAGSADLTSVSQSCDSASSVQGVSVKEEPLDLGYERCSSSINAQLCSRDESVSSSCSNMSNGGTASHGSPTISQSSPPSGSQESGLPVSELQRLQRELSLERIARRQVENELVSAQQDATELQTAMANKHIELLDLARDFHALNGAFKCLSRKFKTVLEESVFQNGLVQTPRVSRPRRPLAEDVEV